MKSSKKSAKLSESEKSEMLEDAADAERAADFRRVNSLAPKRSFQESLAWLTDINRMFPSGPRKSIDYKNQLI